MQLEGRNIYHLAFGQSPFPIPDCFVRELKNYAHKNDYLPVAGKVLLYISFSSFQKKMVFFIPGTDLKNFLVARSFFTFHVKIFSLLGSQARLIMKRS